MERSDAALIASMGAGDQGAFAELYDRHAPRVLGLLVKMLRTRGEADDVLQDTFWHAWRIAAQYDAQRSSVAGWLTMIARSRAIDHMRKRPVPTGAGAEHEGVEEHGPAHDAERQEAQDRTRRALQVLPPEQRHAIQLAFFEGLSHEQIATRESLPLGTVKTRIRLGMQRLRDALSPQYKAAAS